MFAKDVHVRMACLNAVKCIPAVSSRCLAENVEVATSIWIALHDPDKVWLGTEIFNADIFSGWTVFHSFSNYFSCCLAYMNAWELGREH